MMVWTSIKSAKPGHGQLDTHNGNGPSRTLTIPYWARATSKLVLAGLDSWALGHGNYQPFGIVAF